MFYSFWIFQCVVSAAVFYKILQHFKQSFLLAPKTLRKLIVAYVLWVILAGLLQPQKQLGIFLILQLPNVLFLLSKLAITRWREQSFKTHFGAFLSQLILELKMGVGFRPAAKRIMLLHEPYFRNKIEHILQAVIYKQDLTFSPSNGFPAKVLQVFKEIDSSSYQGIEKAQIFLESIQSLEGFKRRSRSITAYVYVQMGVMSVLFVSIVVASVKLYGWHNQYLGICVATAVFVLGVVWVWALGRSFKWNL